MSYTPTEWKAGDTVTSAKLNKIEEGITNAGNSNILIVTVILSGDPHFDKTWQEIHDAPFCVIRTGTSEDSSFQYEYIQSIETDEYGNYWVRTTNNENFRTSDPDNYPYLPE